MDIKVIEIQLNDKHITLIPTAHVSKDSAALVERTIDELHPDSICIELDQDRYESLSNPDKFKNSDIVKIIKEKKVALLVVNLILANYQKRMATSLESTSGAEMRIGIEKAKELNAELVLADRNVQTTFKRVWANLNGADKIKLISTLISAIFDDEEISEEELKNLQQQDALNSALNEISEKFPHIAEVLVDERDRYLAYKIKNAPGQNIVAILGAAHTIHVPEYLKQDYSIEGFDEVPPKKFMAKLSGWIIPALIVIAIIACFRFDAQIGLNQLLSWILINGTLAGLGALLCGGHILSILTAFLAAPITSLNPLLNAGIFAGLVEAYFRKPTVKDFEEMNAVNSFKDFYRNKVTHILMLVLLAGLGSSLGTFVSGIGIVRNFLQFVHLG